MITVWLLLLLTLALDPPGVQTYVNREHGFSITIPADWYFKPSPQRLAEAPGCLNSRTGTAYVYVLIREARGQSCQQMAAEQLQQMLAVSGAIKVVAGYNGPLRVGGRAAWQIVWHSQRDDPYTSFPTCSSYLRAFVPLSSERVLVLAGATLARSPEEARARLQPLQAIVSGVRFLDP